MRPRSLSLGRALRVLFGIVGLVFLAVAFRETWDRSQQTVLPSTVHLASAGALMLGALAFGSRGWACLFDAPGKHKALRGGYYVGQLGKYMPGGVWQAVGQVGLAKGTGIPASRAVAAFLTHAVVQAAAGATVASSLSVLRSDLPPVLRLGSVLGLLLLIPLRRDWTVRVVGLVGRLVRRADVPDDLIASQRGILCSYGWTLVTTITSSFGFAILAWSVRATDSPIAAVPAFAFAWTVGFLAIPFPAGLGVREAVLIAMLDTGAGVAPIIAASLAHRLVTMIAELVMILASKLHAARTT